MPRNRTFCKFIGKLLDFLPREVIRFLPRRHRELVARKLNRPDDFHWEPKSTPTAPQGFEDLSFLFWASPLNRGLIRQDFDEAAALFKIARQCAGGRAVEIGRFNGGGTVLLAVALGEGGRLLSIDKAPQNDALLLDVLRKSGLAERVEIVVADACDFQTAGEFDLVFIDGDHSYAGAARDHDHWGAKLKVGGFLVHHDMANARPLSTTRGALAQLRDDILRIQANELELVREVGSLAIFRRTSESWTPVRKAAGSSPN